MQPKFGLLFALLIAVSAAGQEDVNPAPVRTTTQPGARISITTPLPFGAPPVAYFSPELDHQLSTLQRQLEQGEIELTADETFGFLPSLLKALKIPRESQLLVFSRTSVNNRKISPQNPRAIYFNSETSIGYVPGAEFLELAATDPLKGAIFYSVRQSAEGLPVLKQEARCITCHSSELSFFTPGHVVKSYLTDLRGEPRTGYGRITHATEVHKRMGGWYVTGNPGKQLHLGNLVGEEDEARHNREPGFAGTLASLNSRIDTSKYLSPHSDLVAHLVLQHQLHGQNLLTRVRFEYEYNRHSQAEADLVKYLLVADEAPLDDAVSGSTKYAEWYQRQTPRDSQGRSFWQLDLRQRLFLHGISPLVYSRTFAAYPPVLKQRILSELIFSLLGGNDFLEDRPWEQREAALEILTATVPGCPSVP